MPKKIISKVANVTRDKIFKSIHGNNLIYNTCWEDPRIDRSLMKINSKSQIVMITSAGCNALDYLLDNPEKIYAIDVNSRQNALLELKRALLKHGEHKDLAQFFINGSHPQAKEVYSQVRPFMPEYATEFWDDKISFFSPKGIKKSFYFYGTSGNFAWFMHKFLNTHKKMQKNVIGLLDAESPAEQKKHYDIIEPILWNFAISWLMKRHTTMALLGVPRAQRELIENQYPGGILDFLKSSLRHVFTEISVKDNYFWRVYLTGRYTDSCSPEYLKEHNFKKYKTGADKIEQHTATIAEFLKSNPGNYSHYVLLDHQDWLAWNNPAALAEEWELILKNSKKGTIIMLRSAAAELDFIPEFVFDRVKFHPEKTKPLHFNDRVGTYESFHMGTVK